MEKQNLFISPRKNNVRTFEHLVPGSRYRIHCIMKYCISSGPEVRCSGCWWWINFRFQLFHKNERTLTEGARNGETNKQNNFTFTFTTVVVVYLFAPCCCLPFWPLLLCTCCSLPVWPLLLFTCCCLPVWPCVVYLCSK